MNSDLLNGLNEHLKLEFRASHEYLAMAIWLAEHDLPGFSKWMRQQSSDELMHAQRIIDHLVERDQKVVLPAVGAPPTGWASAEALCDHVLKNEQEVTASINNLYAMAEKTKDRPATVMLQWFVTEQMEEEAAARAVLGRIRLAGNSGVGLLMIDQELVDRPRAGHAGRRRPATPSVLDATRLFATPFRASNHHAANGVSATRPSIRPRRWTWPSAQDWPSFRGPHGSGVSPTRDAAVDVERRHVRQRRVADAQSPVSAIRAPSSGAIASTSRRPSRTRRRRGR